MARGRGGAAEQPGFLMNSVTFLCRCRLQAQTWLSLLHPKGGAWQRGRALCSAVGLGVVFLCWNPRRHRAPSPLVAKPAARYRPQLINALICFNKAFGWAMQNSSSFCLVGWEWELKDWELIRVGWGAAAPTCTNPGSPPWGLGSRVHGQALPSLSRGTCRGAVAVSPCDVVMWLFPLLQCTSSPAPARSSRLTGAAIRTRSRSAPRQ